MISPAASNTALLDRLAQVLHEMGLPCACQDEVERTVAVFADFENRRIRRRLLNGALEQARRLAAYVSYLDDLEGDESTELAADELTALADCFRVIASTAAEGAANLEMLASVKSSREAPPAPAPHPGEQR